MTKFNQALFASISSAALMFGAFGLISPPSADAGTTCSTNSWGQTSCFGDGGSFNSSTNSFGQTSYYGTDNNGNSYSGSCSTNSWGTTTCY